MVVWNNLRPLHAAHVRSLDLEFQLNKLQGSLQVRLNRSEKIGELSRTAACVLPVAPSLGFLGFFLQLSSAVHSCRPAM